MNKKILFIIFAISSSLVIASSSKKETFRKRLTPIMTNNNDRNVSQQRVNANKSCRDLCCVSMCVYSIVLCTIVISGLSPIAYDSEKFPIHYIPKTNIRRK